MRHGVDYIHKQCTIDVMSGLRVVLFTICLFISMRYVSPHTWHFDVQIYLIRFDSSSSISIVLTPLCSCGRYMYCIYLCPPRAWSSIYIFHLIWTKSITPPPSYGSGIKSSGNTTIRHGVCLSLSRCRRYKCWHGELCTFMMLGRLGRIH